MTDETLEEARQHDAALRARGLDFWIGAEPTFTRRQSQEPWWLTEAEGGDKEEHARALLLALAEARSVFTLDLRRCAPW